MAANVETMMFVQETPWHGLGTRVEQELTSEQAIVAAGLDWTVKLSKLAAVVGGDADAPVLSGVDGYRAVVRESDMATLGVVGERYTPIQNKSAFDFFDNVVGEKAAMFHTAGALANGSRIWMLAKLPKSMLLANGEEIEKYLLLVNSHDGSMCLRMQFTPVRVVCQNTMTMALKDKGQDGISIRHTINAQQKVQQAQRALKLASAYYEGFEQTANMLIATPFTEKQMVKVAEAMFPAKDEDVSTRSNNMRDEVVALFTDGTGMDKIKGSAWAAYNAVTEFTDHKRSTRACGDTSAKEAKLVSTWFGSGKALKDAGMSAIEGQIQMAA